MTDERGSKPQIEALDWLLKRSPNILLMPGKSKGYHLHDNIEATQLELIDTHMTRLNNIVRLTA